MEWSGGPIIVDKDMKLVAVGDALLHLGQLKCLRHRHEMFVPPAMFPARDWSSSTYWCTVPGCVNRRDIAATDAQTWLLVVGSLEKSPRMEAALTRIFLFRATDAGLSIAQKRLVIESLATFWVGAQ